MLTISDQSFDLAHASFTGHISTHGLRWDFELHGMERVVEEIEWEPKLTAHALEWLQLPQLSKLPGYETSLPNEDEEGEPPFLLYVFEHCPLLESKLAFGKWRENNQIDMELTGVANVFASEKYDQNLAIKYRGAVPFEGIQVDEYRVEAASKVFQNYFDPAHFEAPQQRDTPGWWFSPANET